VLRFGAEDRDPPPDVNLTISSAPKVKLIPFRRTVPAGATMGAIMQLPAILDVAITLVTAYVLLSLLCTTLSEFITTLLRTRARSLGRSVDALLDDLAVKKAFLSSGLLTSMSTSVDASGAPRMPSYLASRTFADALLGALVPGSDLPGVAEVQKRIVSLDDSKLKDALMALVSTAAAEGTSLRDDIAGWFDDAMERLSGSYVRYMKYFSLALGFVIAASLNVDTLALAGRTWTDRAQIVVPLMLAGGLAEACPDTGNDSVLMACQTASMSKLVEQMKVLPIGWEGNVPAGWGDLRWLVSKLVGLLLTALAISIGAPFWFDVLQLVMNLRGTGTKPLEADDKR